VQLPTAGAWLHLSLERRRQSRARVIFASLFYGGDELDVAVLDGLQPHRGDGDRDQLLLAHAVDSCGGEARSGTTRGGGGLGLEGGHPSGGAPQGGRRVVPGPGGGGG